MFLKFGPKLTIFRCYCLRKMAIFATFQNVIFRRLGVRLTKRRPIFSVGRAPDCRAGGRGFKTWPDQHSGSLNAEKNVQPL